jgi:PAS domain S-box-containing protein
VSISTYDKQADGYRPVAQAGKTLAEFEADAQRMRPVDEIRGLMQPRWRVSNSYFLPSEEADEWGLDTLSFVQEPASDTETVRGPRAWQPNDLLLVPMLGSSENPLGYISPDVPYNERRPDMDTLESLEVFAAQAAFIIENFQLVESVQLEAQAARRERDRLARLHLVSDEIQRTTDMHERLQVIADGIVSVGWERVQITLRNARMEPELLIHSGYSEEEARRLESRLLPGEVWRERLNDLEFHELRLGNAYYLRYDAPWVQKNMFRDRKPDPPQVKIYEWHPQDVLYMPLIGQDQRRIIGLIRMEGPADGRRPRADSLQPIELFASQAAAVIENTRLYEETVRQAAIEQRLNELMEAMASTLDQTEIIRALANGLKRLIEVTRLHLAMPNVDQPNTLELTRVEYTADGKVHIFPDSNIEREGSALGEVFDKGEAQSFDLNNVEITLNYQDLANWSEEGEHNTLLVPMITGGEAIGVLRLGSEDERENVFADEQNQNLIQRMANLSAVSVQNSRLFTSLEATTSFNQAVVESIQQGIVVLDNDIRIRIINNFMVTRYKWSREAQGRLLFSYRPEFRDFLEESISKALETGEEQHKFDIQDIDADGNLLIRNFYTYPLRQGQRMTGVVLLVEDITERALLGVELASRAEQLAALTNVSNQMTQILQPNQVVEVVLDALGTVIPYDGVGLWLVSSNNPQRLEIRAARGFHDQGTTPEELIGIWVEIESSDLFREMALEKKVINVGDTATDTKRFPYGSQRAYRNWLGAPLISKGDVIGVLQLEKTQPNFYDEHHEQLVIAFANQAAVALNNAQLFAETQERAEQLNKQAERLELLNRVSASLAHSLDQENIFEITLKETAHALGIEEAAAIKIDPENNLGRIIIEYPRGHEEPTTIFQLTSAPIIQQIRDLLKPVVVDDFPASQHYEQLKPIVRRDNVSAMVFVPLVLSGSVVGIMRFDATQPGHRFTPEQIELAQTISSQAAIAVQNASLYEQSVRRTYELQTLFDASQSIAVTLDSEDVMRRVSTLMLIALQADTSAIMMWDNVSSTLEVVETSTSWDDIAVAERGTVYDLDKYPVRKQVIQDQSVIVLRTDQENIDPAERESMEKSGVHNRLFAPLIVNEVSIGLVQVEMRDIVRAFEGDQVRLTRTLTSQAAIAIENARLQSETRTQIEELYLINDLSKAVSSTVELGGLLDQVRDQLPMLTEAEYVYVALYEDDKNTISFPLAVDQNLDTFEIEGGRLNEADEFGWIVKRQRPLLLAGENLDQVRASFGINEPSFPNARCFLGVPMIVGDSVIGVLALRDDHEPLRFSHSEQRILTTVGSQLAVAIQNARLFEQTAAFATELEERVLERTREVELERQRLSTLYEIASEIAAATLDLERVLKRTLELVSEAIGASSGVVLKIDDISDQLFVYEQLGLDVENEEERLQLRLNEGLAGWIIQNRQGVVIEDLQKDYRWIAISEREKKPRSAVAALMEGGDEIAGVIMFYNEEVGVFNEDHLRLVSAAASQLANAMSSAELYELIRDQAERLGAILRQEQIESTKNTAILNSIADGVMYANQTGIIRVFNNTASRILGLMDDQVLNRHISEVSGIFGGRSSGWTDVIDEWMEDPTLIQPGHFKEEILNLQDGRVISVRLSPVNMGDQFLGTVSVFRDITREAELDRLKSEFVANVSHELRTPMTSIKGYADLLLLGAAGEISEAQQRFLQTIKQNADRLSILVNDLLEISKLDQTEDLEFAPVDVNDIIEFAASHLSGRVRDEDKQIEIKTSVNGDLPPIRADHDKIMQIMQNLSDNAFNYTMSGGSITLGAQYVPDDQAVIMTVQDTGIGIPEEAQPRVFERFFRGDEYSQVVFDTPGTGLGLAIVKELVTIHKGEISFKSVPEKGTTFYVKIPTVTSRIENSRDSSDTTDSDIR